MSNMRTFREIHQRLESVVSDINWCGRAASSDIADLIEITDELETAIADAENCQAASLTTVAKNKIRK